MNGRPRVLYLSGWPIGARGQGAVSFVYEQIEALSAVVDAVYADVHLQSVDRYAARLLSGTTTTPITHLWTDHVTALDVWVPRWSTRITRRSVLEDVERAAMRVARRLEHQAGPFDLVHAHVVLPAGLIGAAIARALDVPLVLQEHSGPFEMHLETDEQRNAVRRVLRAADAALAVSDELAGRMTPWCDDPARLHVVPNLVRTDLFPDSPIPGDRESLRLVTVATLHPIKALETMLEAVAALRERQPVSLGIVGDGETRDALGARVAELGLAEHASFTGALSRADTARAIADSHIYVCSSRHETFGLAPAEALSSGRPVVSTRCGGPEAFVDDDCGALVPVDDAAALADGILATWRRIDAFDPRTMHERIEHRYGVDAFRERMLALYESVLALEPVRV